MNKRSFLYSAAVIGLMAAGTAGITQAQADAQKSVALQPSTQWAVNKVNSTDGKGGYCALARRYRPNTILTFARNQNDEASFAIDFQTPKFRQAEGMEVRLNPGEDEIRGFEVYPVSNQAFVIRLGDDKPFFEALEKTGSLSVTFGGDTYEFDLSDIDTGQSKLETCIASSIIPAAGSSDAAYNRSASARSTKNTDDDSYKSDIAELRRQIAELQNSNQKLANAPVEPVTREANNDTEGRGSVVIDQMSEHITALEQENQDLEAKLKAVQNGDDNDLRAGKDVGLIDKLTKENQDLRAALETKQSDDIQAEVLQDQIQTLQSENEKLRGASKQVDASGVDPNNVLKLMKENDKLRLALNQKVDDSSQTQDLRKTITSLQDENTKLKSSSGTLEESRKQIEALKDENTRLQSVVKATEVTGDNAFIVKELKGQVTKLSTENEDKQQKLIELSKLTTEIQMLKTTNEQLEQQLVESALHTPTTAANVNQRVAALETQNDALLQKIQSASDAATGTDAATIDALKTENEQLKKTIADNQTLVEANKTLQQQVESLRKENSDLKAKVDAAAAAAGPGGDLAAQLQKAQDDNKTLQLQLQQKEAELAELPGLREQVARLTKENEELKAAAKNPVMAAAAPGDAPNPEVATLHSENESLRKQIEGMGNKDSEIADLKKKLADQEAKIAAAEDAQKKAEADAKAAQDVAAKQTKDAKAAQTAAEKKAQKQIDDLKAAQAKQTVQPETSPVPVAEEKTSDAAPVIVKDTPSKEDTKAKQEARNDKKIAIEPEPLAPPSDTTAIENEMNRLEQKLSEAKASGDQMAIQQAARDYIKLKIQLSASQELAQSEKGAPTTDEAKALLAYAGTGKAPVADVQKEETMQEPSPAPVAASSSDQPPSEDLLQAGSKAKPSSDVDADAAPEPMNEAQKQDEKLSAHASEDPYADMKVEDDFKGYESKSGGAVKEAKDDAKAAVKQTATLPDDANADMAAKNQAAGDAYRARINDSRMVTPESVREAQAQSKDLMEQANEKTNAVSNDDQTADWGQATKADATSASHGAIYKPAVGIPQLLSKANVVSADAVTVVPAASGSDKLSYQWKADKVYGSAVQEPLSDASRFDNDVQAYLAQTKQRCGQDFAVVPDTNTGSGDNRVSTYEIACVGKGVSSSASLIFFSQKGVFTVLAHETPTEELDSAMDIRDKLLKAIGG